MTRLGGSSAKPTQEPIIGATIPRKQNSEGARRGLRRKGNAWVLKA